MTKEQIQAVMDSVDAANPGLRMSNRFAWTEKVAVQCYAVDKTVGQKKADKTRPVSDDTIGWLKAGPPIQGAPGTTSATPMTGVDLLSGSTGKAHFNEIDLTTKDPLSGDFHYFVVPPASGASSAPSGPTYPPYPGDKAFDPIGLALFKDFEEAGQAPNVRMSCWYGRTIYDWLTGVCPDLESSIVKHRGEWRAALGLPPTVTQP